MGFADTVTKAYMNENSVFADAFNYLIYEGKAVVDPQHLKEMDTTEIVVPFGMRDEGKADKSDVAQKYRDILKSAVIKQDDKVTYILFGIENQTDIHYAMPVIGCIKYSKDKKQLAGFLKDNPRMLMEVSAARVIKTITNTPIVIPEEEERIDMCKAIEDMISDSKAEGKKEGKKEGRKEGALITLAGLVRDGVLSMKDAALRLNMTESAFEAEIKRLAD